MKFIIPILAVLSLAACVPDKVETDPVSVQLTGKGRAAKPDAFVPLVVRVYENVEKNRVWIEERHVTECKLSSSHFSARFGTPARVMMPNYGDAMPRTSVSCSFAGETKTSNVTCFFERGATPGSAEYPRGRCSFATVNIIFGK